MQVYLDYMANTPIDDKVLQEFNLIYKKYYANPNSIHKLGLLAKEEIEKCSKSILAKFDLEEYEIIYTSGASEANNLAIKGIAESYRQDGKHIISTYLEHSSLSASLTYLQQKGYEIDLVKIDENGRVDLENLKELIRKDTILVSICYVDSELGIVQPIDEIKEILKDYPNCFFHSDATQAVAKVDVNFKSLDLITFTPHKFYGLNSSGVLLKKKDLVLGPLVHGGKSTTIYRSGTPDLPMVFSLDLALKIALENLKSRNEYILTLKNKLIGQLKKYEFVRINSNEFSVVNNLNLSVIGIKAIKFQEKLSENGIYISTKSACDFPMSPSRAVFAISKDKKVATSSWRISLSHLTTLEEIEYFLEVFKNIYKEMLN